MDSNQRLDHIYNRAHALAVTGHGPLDVVSKLVKEGYPEAASVLDSELIRADLSRLADTSASSDIIAMLWSFDAMALAEKSKLQPTRDPVGGLPGRSRTHRRQQGTRRQATG